MSPRKRRSKSRSRPAESYFLIVVFASASRLPPCSSLIDAHEIHQHARGERRRVVGAARQVSAYRQVQDDEERVPIEDPARPIWHGVRDALRIELSVHVIVN